MTVNTGTVTTRLTTTSTATMRSTRRRGSRSAGASCPSDSRPENASHAAANPVAVSVQLLRRHVLEAGPERDPVKLGHLRQDRPRPAPPSQASAAIAIASATRGSSRTPTQCSEPSSSKRDHRQHRDLVRERTDRRDVVQRRHHRDGDGQQVGADHQRARDDADARAERLAGGRHPAPALRVAARDLQVSERDEHEGDRRHQHEHRRQAADLGVEDRRDVVDRRPEVGEHHRPGQRRAQVADAAAGGSVQFDFGSGRAARGVFRHQWGRSFHPSPRRRNWMTGNNGFVTETTDPICRRREF